jgi:hypothetical protein
MANSGTIKFAMGAVPSDSNEQKVPTETPQPNAGEVKVDLGVQREENESLDREYFDRRSVSISLVKNYSLYRKANDKIIGKRSDYIGSSISSSRTLSANKAEVEAYFPNIIGLAPNNENFITRVKQYLNNFQVKVDEVGKTLNISFHYYKKRDFFAIKEQEDKINEEYDAFPRQDLNKLKEALKNKIVKLNALESTKYQYGYPDNVEEYLIYRHCLLYNDVAKDIAFINSDPNVRFYFKDDQKEAEKLAKFRTEVNRAKSNYLTCVQDKELFDAVYIQYCNFYGLPIISSLAESTIVKENNLDKFSATEPVKFNKICGDKDIRLVATIEKLISRGELTRLPNNQNIVLPSGEFVGSNVKEAVIWFKNPDNASVVSALSNKLKNY